ncbi:MAG: CDP-glucose 4,6-dehydratase [candidate division WOR-3 bacterium]
MSFSKFWVGKRVVITGHTGFKGGWLALWLWTLGAKVYGYSLPPPTEPNFFSAVNLQTCLEDHIVGDVRDYASISKVMLQIEPEIVFHLAAQSLVGIGYKDPLTTYETNVMGTVNLLEAVRNTPSVKEVIIITSDKCYENREWVWPYRETDTLGGFDPYSSSKACAEIISSSYKRAFFKSKVALATARAGNVIGGGDWAQDRLIPDCIKAFTSNKPVILRNPHSLRPWQHVLEPLFGYLILAEKIYSNPDKFSGPWNFSPYAETGDATVYDVAKLVADEWEGVHILKKTEESNTFHEAAVLRLDNTKAVTLLNWKPKWSLKEAVKETVKWYKQYYAQEGVKDMKEFSIRQISEYMDTPSS